MTDVVFFTQVHLLPVLFYFVLFYLNLKFFCKYEYVTLLAVLPPMVRMA